MPAPSHKFPLPLPKTGLLKWEETPSYIGDTNRVTRLNNRQTQLISLL